MKDVSFSKGGNAYVGMYVSEGYSFVQVKAAKSGKLTVSWYIGDMEPVVVDVAEISNTFVRIDAPAGINVRLESSVEIKACKVQVVEKSAGEGESDYTLPQASDSALGGIKTGYTQSGKNYPLKLDGSGKAYVEVPWTDNNTTYQAATDSVLGLVKKGAAVTDATGQADAHAQLNKLLAELRKAGVIAS